MRGMSEMTEVEMLRAELSANRAAQGKLVKQLASIYALLYPKRVEVDGKAFEFRPSTVDPHALMQELSDRIRAIPEVLDNQHISMADIEFQLEDHRRPPTYRREEAVRLLLSMGWKWIDGKWQANAQGEAVAQADDELHARIAVGPSPHYAVRLQSSAYNAARAAFGTKTEADDRGVYWAIQAYLHAASTNPAERADVPDGWKLVPVEPTEAMA